MQMLKKKSTQRFQVVEVVCLNVSPSKQRASILRTWLASHVSPDVLALYGGSI